ncbi:copine-8-like isoform X2 [Ptychodera flava]|uniref:copine-8-like isoform X2 n=1 Tax=Ptychodera flava TaxID=63121 RepID=UPI00396AAC62
MEDRPDFLLPGQAIPVTKVEISVSARNILDMDTFSKSDPICVMYIQKVGSNKFTEYGRTEIIWNNLNPDFVTKFSLDYFFEERQELKFELYDVDAKSDDLSKHDFLGEVQCSLGEVCSSRRLDLPIQGKSDCGTMIISAEEIGESRDVVRLEFKGEGLDKKDFFGKSDPFLAFYRANDDGSYTIVHKTERIMRTLNPTWKPFSISVMNMCGNDYDRKLRVQCWDWNRSGSHDFIGEFFTDMRQLTRGPNQSNVYELVDPKKKSKKSSYENSGIVTLVECRVQPRYSFLDYIRGGTQMHFTVAIDFTASNGKPDDPGSLHFLHGDQPNIYETALRSVGSVLQDYDSTKNFPALGFGARVPPDGRVSFDFFLNGHPSNPYCHGIDGVIAAYRESLKRVYLHGPTNFAPVIDHVAKFAENHKEGNHYFVLLIVTDGSISDMAKTKDAIVKAATLPMSIIIVGVGNEDFSAMEVLDGDNVRVTSSDGTAAVRDIVQFVCLRDFLDSNNAILSKSRLSREVLEEIPEQFLSWMTANHVKPRNLPTVKPMSYNTTV